MLQLIRIIIEQKNSKLKNTPNKFNRMDAKIERKIDMIKLIDPLEDFQCKVQPQKRFYLNKI